MLRTYEYPRPVTACHICRTEEVGVDRACSYVANVRRYDMWFSKFWQLLSKCLTCTFYYLFNIVITLGLIRVCWVQNYTENNSRLFEQSDNRRQYDHIVRVPVRVAAMNSTSSTLNPTLNIHSLHLWGYPRIRFWYFVFFFRVNSHLSIKKKLFFCL